MLPTQSSTVAQQVALTSAYSYDAVGRLTASAHSAPNTLTLPSGTTLSDTIGANASGYAWDANGNRSQSYYSSSTAGGTATLQRDYQIASNSNRLDGYTQTFTPAGGSAQTTNVSYNHDAAGSITRKGDSYLHYGVDGRIAKAGPSADPANALAVSYTYNALGQRVFKSDARLSGANNPAITQQTVYAEDGIGSTVLGQYGSRRSSDSAAPAGEMDSTEVIYLPTANGPMPIAAQINGRLYAIDADHLNTPRRLTNTQGQVAWQWLITGFGEANPTTGATGYTQSGQGSSNYSEAIRFDLRYPGQVFDEETQLNYNLHRSYDPPSGRYFQADPIGLDGGWNRFAYVSGDPLHAIDPQGLFEIIRPSGSPSNFTDANILLRRESFLKHMGGLMQEKINKLCAGDRAKVQPIFDRWKVYVDPNADNIYKRARGAYAYTYFAGQKTQFNRSMFDLQFGVDPSASFIMAHEFRHLMEENHRISPAIDFDGKGSGEKDANNWSKIFNTDPCVCGSLK
ncbi:RHS repeat-associated core domain-containing protein [Acidovorax sp. BLS4]|uniref:RHS repeat-associated core domain-containing protein n=1 Tax=Acidovorax sp. BLS4 TaxID=3273430 RepID=UPI002943F861|nr:RHS repeat-associated core domain-containing protein [Paracidovorax avenae]WOI45635.1 RHS repeat-associated core domain-containing protein [Paracidovorax avenae]